MPLDPYGRPLSMDINNDAAANAAGKQIAGGLNGLGQADLAGDAAELG